MNLFFDNRVSNPYFYEFKHLFKNKNLKKIVNVYQNVNSIKNIKNNMMFGIGDFYRGCFYLYYICKMLNLEFDINIKNHLISNLIVTRNHEDKNIIYNEINYMSDKMNTNLHIDIYMINLINYLNDCKDDICYLICNLRYDIFDIKNPKYGITQSLTPIIINKIRPNDILTSAIEERLNILNLKKKNYGVIHLRCGDDFILKEDIFNINEPTKSLMNKNKFIKIINIIKKLNINNKKYLLIGDNNSVKFELNKIFPNFISIKNEITHLGCSNERTYESVKDTMIDFYLMAISQHIISFTVYGHGSGFCEYCAVIYGIRFKQYKLDMY